MSSNYVVVSLDAGVATLTLNRPEIHNAFDDMFITDLIAALKKLETNEHVQIVVLAATGKSFSAGANINWMKKIAHYTYEQNIADANHLTLLMQTLKYLKKPTLARIQGPALGGGVGLVACCDMAIASTDAYFALSEVKIGLIPAVISPYVISMIGERAARRYFLTGETISAEEACRLGLINKAVSVTELDMTIQSLVTHLKNNSQAAVISAKELINRIIHIPYDPAHQEKNAEVIATIRASKEGQEGLAAFLQKRKPNW